MRGSTPKESRPILKGPSLSASYRTRSRAKGTAQVMATVWQARGISLCALRRSPYDKWKEGTRAAVSGLAVAVGGHYSPKWLATTTTSPSTAIAVVDCS